jgi:hypothetical protein
MLPDTWSASPPDPADRLYPQCMFCGCSFPHSELFSRVPPGDRLAYDPERGRIWSICGRCARWNLIPVEERFDAIEELERVIRDRATFLAATANVALYDVGDLTVIRIGRALLAERSAWRYGRELLARHTGYNRTGTRLAAATADAVARVAERVTGVRLDRHWGPTTAADVIRWQRFGTVAWNGRTSCDACNSVLHTLHFDSAWWLYPRVENGRLIIGVPCTRCDPWTPRNVFDLHGTDGDTVLRRALAYQHVAGANAADLDAATALLQHAGTAERFIATLATGRTSLWRQGRVATLALEIAANHLADRRALEIRLHGVEAEWRSENELAEIVDHELS